MHITNAESFIAANSRSPVFGNGISFCYETIWADHNNAIADLLACPYAIVCNVFSIVCNVFCPFVKCPFDEYYSYIIWKPITPFGDWLNHLVTDYTIWRSITPFENQLHHLETYYTI